MGGKRARKFPNSKLRTWINKIDLVDVCLDVELVCRKAFIDEISGEITSGNCGVIAPKIFEVV